MFSNKDYLPDRGTIQVKNIRGNHVKKAGTVQEPPKPIVIAPQEVNRCGTEIGDVKHLGTTRGFQRQDQYTVSRDVSGTSRGRDRGRMMRNASQQLVARSTTEKVTVHPFPMVVC